LELDSPSHKQVNTSAHKESNTNQTAQKGKEDKENIVNMIGKVYQDNVIPLDRNEGLFKNDDEINNSLSNSYRMKTGNDDELLPTVQFPPFIVSFILSGN
jgi:hypothetical protein